MRLTLRTLLAFMDGILEPEDAEDIGRKTRESEFATGLLHRTRDVMRRVRLGVPQDPGAGGGEDPNTVAEYLDNTLADDRVPDFERTCLESDVHLAEVASCHQILTLVLGSPAEVDPASRERMYRVPEEAIKRSEEETTASGKLGVNPPELPSIQAAPSRRAKPTVPDYLREPSRPRMQFLGTAGLAVLTVLVVGAVFYATGQLKPGRPMARLLARATGAAQATPASEKPATEAESAAAPTSVPSASSIPSTSGPAAELASPSRAEFPSQPQVAKPMPPQPPLAAELLTPEARTAGGAVQPGAKTEAAPPKESAAAKPGSAAPPGVSGERPSPPVESPKMESQRSPAEPAGRLTSEVEVLLESKPGAADWTRVPAQGTVIANQELVALPAFRPSIAMTGMAVQLMGGAEVKLQSAGQRGIPGLDVLFGQAVVRSLGQPEIKFWLQVGDQGGTLTLGDSESTVAIDVARPLSPGADPEKQPNPLRADLYAVAGRILWQPRGAQEARAIAAPARLRVSQPAAEPDGTIREFPKWVFSDPTGEMDRKASPIVAEALKADRPVSLSLQELADHRRTEVRWLAVRCLGHVGQFGPMVVALNDADQKPAWPDYIAELRSAMTRGPGVAAQVRRAMEKEYGAEAPKLCRMLWGYTEEELQQEGGANTLVKTLDDDLLAARVLAFWNLKEVTVTGLTLYYRPEAPAAKRQQALQKWRQRIQSEKFWRSPTRSKAP